MLGADLDTSSYLSRLKEEIDRLDQGAIQRWADLIYTAWEQEKFVFVFGNGGSGTNATHFSEDLGKSIHLCVFHWVLNDVYARINQEGRYA